MAHVINIIKTAYLKRKLKKYINEKEIGKNEYETDYEYHRRRKFKSKFKTPNTIQNFIFKSFLGFVGGILLTYIFFCFFYIGINFSLKTTTYMCAIGGIFLCLGLAFSSKIRCYVLLLIPVFFSKQGRQALLAYALFLSFTGPTKNSMQNIKILSDSMICGQEMIKVTLTQVIDMMKAPNRSIKDILEKIKKSLEDVVEKMNNFILTIKKIIVCILSVIQKATDWLGSIVNFCNKKIGTPFQRCMRTFDEAITDCKAKMGVMDFLCHVVHVVKGLCYTVKTLDFICLFTDFVSEKIIQVVKRKLNEFNLRMENLFYVSIEFNHSYEFETEASNTTNKETHKTILVKITEKFEKIQNFFSFCGFMFGFSFIFIFFKVYYYRYKYLSSDIYDNIYISKYILKLDIKRAQMDRETVLPLEAREKKKYGKPTTIRLLKNEKIRVMQSIFLLSLTSFKIITFLAVDYSLFWTLLTIYEAGHTEFDIVEKTTYGLQIKGQGVLADFYRNLERSFQIAENPNLRISPLKCLPDPVEPDLGRYIQIGFLVGICWALTLTEPYGLRLRNIVMSHYYPDRARERAVWLYNHILQSRGSFLRYARRQLRKKFGIVSQKSIEKITLTQRLFAVFPLLGAIFGKNIQNNCLLCDALETKSEVLKRCKTPDCQGRYCVNCFRNLDIICTICQHPIEYGDISDISEEIDSSEEEVYKKYEESRRHLGYKEARYSNKFETFKDMELRKEFRDVEAYKIPDYVKLGDLYRDKGALKAKLREVINRHIKNIEREKNREEEQRRSELLRIKSKLQNLIKSIKNKKNQIKKAKKTKLMKGIKQMIVNMKGSILENERKDNILKFEKIGTYINMENGRPEIDYKKIKEKVRKKIKAFKKEKNVKFENFISESSD